jgi:hypothetical protein
MPQTKYKVNNLPSASTAPRRDRRIAWGSFAIRRVWYRLRMRMLCTWSTWRTVFRSALGHIQIQDTKEPPNLEFGPALADVPQEGCHAPNMRTHARILYTQMLSAKYEWADFADKQIFLMGFDAGEHWRSHNPYNETETSNPQSSSWITPIEQITEKLDQIVAANYLPSNKSGRQCSWIRPPI